jgi:AhpD family alkylhydroperoxidase
MQTQDLKSVFDDVKNHFGLVPGWVKEVPPNVLSHVWGTMRDFQLAETEIPNKYKELIGLAVSGATRCRYCTLFHTEAARLFGATDSEIAEASLMGGFTMQMSTFLNAQQIDYDQFRKETLSAIDHVRKQLAKTTGRGTEARS